MEANRVAAWLFALLVLSACRRDFEPPAKMGEQRRVVGPFSRVEVAGELSARIDSGSPVAVTLHAEESVLPKIHTETKDGLLKLWLDDAAHPKVMPVVEVTLPALDSLSATGASKVVAKLDRDKLGIDASDASRIELAGRVDELALRASGAAEISAQALRANAITIEGSGAGGAKVRAEKRLSANLSGAFVLTLSGDPEVTQRLSGAARIQRH